MINSQVSGGVDACAANAPWNIIIENKLLKKRKRRNTDNNLIDVSCGGSLVTEKHAVTAAHCFMRNKNRGDVCPEEFRSCWLRCPSPCIRTKPSDLTVYVGKTRRFKEDPVSVKSIHIHPDFKRSLLGDKLETDIIHEGIDLAVLEFEKPLLLSINSVWPVCLPISNDRYMYEPEETMDLYGFGNVKGPNSSPRILQVGTLIIKSSEYCSSQYNDGQAFEKLVCTLGEEVKNKRQAGSCRGDSGGGAVSQRRSSQSYVLLALVSFGRQDCGKEKRLPSVMTNVLNHVDWIRKIIGKCESITEDGKACKFPFLYNGIQHDCCTTQDSNDRSWCVTELDAFGRNNKDPGTWGYCIESELYDTSLSLTSTTSTTTVTTTTTSTNSLIETFSDSSDRPECTSYTTLSDASRSIYYGSGKQKGSDVDGKWFCDYPKYKNGNIIESPGWVGPAWYRFTMPAGIRIPESSPGDYHCGTFRTGWLSGSHPTSLGDSRDVKFCFAGNISDCDWSTQGKVTNCGGYFVYYLQNIPKCRQRYCATN